MATDPFVVTVARLRRTPGNQVHQVLEGLADPDHDLAASASSPSGIPSGANARCEVVLQSCLDGSITASGSLHTRWEGVCRRCATAVDGDLDIAFQERFVEAKGAELEDEEAYPVAADRIDLAVLIHDALVLELPLAPVCKEDCMGLCPWCGTDRNVESCTCVAAPDPRWANLDVLRSPS
jgi:uncharacterized protein